MFFGVFYYEITMCGQSATVYPLGYYQEYKSAVSRLKEILPNYKPYYKNSVISGNLIGWINSYEFGDFDSKGLCASQPHSSVDCFNKISNI